MKEEKKCKVEFSMEMEDGMKTEVSKEMSMVEAKKMMQSIKDSMMGDKYMKGGMDG